MKLIFSLSIAALFAVISGCASNQNTAASEKGAGHWVTLEPELGSHVSRRVWVADDSTIGPGNSQVRTMSPESMRDMQRQGSISTGRPGR